LDMTLGAEGRDQGHQGCGALLKYRGERSVIVMCPNLIDFK